MSKQKKNNKSSLETTTQSQNRADFSMFLTVFYYCILIILLPVMSFFTSKYLLEVQSYFDLTSVAVNIYSAVVAVIALHLALGLYLYRAYSEGDPPKQSMYKQD